MNETLTLFQVVQLLATIVSPLIAVGSFYGFVTTKFQAIAEKQKEQDEAIAENRNRFNNHVDRLHTKGIEA